MEERNRPAAGGLLGLYRPGMNIVFPRLLFYLSLSLFTNPNLVYPHARGRTDEA